MTLRAPLLKQAGGEFKGADLGLAEGKRLGLLAPGDIGKADLDEAPKSTHAEANMLVRGGPAGTQLAVAGGRRRGGKS